MAGGGVVVGGVVVGGVVVGGVVGVVSGPEAGGLFGTFGVGPDGGFPPGV